MWGLGRARVGQRRGLEEEDIRDRQGGKTVLCVCVCVLMYFSSTGLQPKVACNFLI